MTKTVPGVVPPPKRIDGEIRLTGGRPFRTQDAIDGGRSKARKSDWTAAQLGDA
jgi:hypothetical protein